MPKRLIINSDDYGRTPDISRGIREAHLKGVVTSATCMMNIPTTADDVRVALKETPDLKLGVHLVLTMGKPLSKNEAVSSVVDGDGNFFKYDAFVDNLQNLVMDQVKSEWRLQIERFVQTTGHKPTHLDSHHHSSFFSAELFRGMLELAREYECAIRYPFTNVYSEIEEAGKYASDWIKEYDIRHPDVFISEFYDDSATFDAILGIVNNLEEGVSELMCHPGHVDDAFSKESTYNFQRARELKILTDSAVKHAIENNNIQLISFSDL
ncbi:MAG TPA: ChbG/HpnK family deacetylase [Anaerolineales bacterium]|nr:ChbG/HpnK family deacetylase [Anaerolineales bacterium]